MSSILLLYAFVALILQLPIIKGSLAGYDNSKIIWFRAQEVVLLKPHLPICKITKNKTWKKSRTQLHCILPIGSVCMPYIAMIMVCHLPSTITPVLWQHQSSQNRLDPSYGLVHESWVSHGLVHQSTLVPQKKYGEPHPIKPWVPNDNPPEGFTVSPPLTCPSSWTGAPAPAGVQQPTHGHRNSGWSHKKWGCFDRLHYQRVLPKIGRTESRTGQFRRCIRKTKLCSKGPLWNSPCKNHLDQSNSLEAPNGRGF